MNFISRLFSCVLLMTGCFQSRAFNYNDEDLLLIFRKDGFNDIEFNLGPVSQLVNHPQGTDAAITNWDVEKVKTLYDLSDDVRMLLIASTSKDIANRIAWLTCSEDGTEPLDRTASQWQAIWSKISGVGGAAERFTDTNDLSYYSVGSSDLSSYTFTASNGGTAAALIPKLGGASVFTIEGTIPVTLRFFQIKPSTVLPKPPAALVGSFTITTAGNLTFHSGTSDQNPIPVPSIGELTRSNGASVVTFEGVVGISYRLRHSDAAGLSAPVASWSIGTDVVAGTGGPASLSDSSAETARFYVVEAFR